MSNAAISTPEGLEGFNQVLSKNNLPTLNEKQFEALQNERPKVQLANAASRISTDPGARAYIQKAMTAIGIDTSTKDRPSNRADQDNPAVIPETSSKPQHDSPNPNKRGRYPRQEEVGNQDESPFSDNIHVYGGRAALCFEPTLTRSSENPTVTMDAAVSTQPRRYDWQNKVRVQFTRSELPVVACVLLGLLPNCEYKNHGASNDKGFSFESQKGKLFAKVWAKDKSVRAVPIEAPDIYRISTLVLEQLQATSPNLSTEGIIQVLRMTVARRMS